MKASALLGAAAVTFPVHHALAQGQGAAAPAAAERDPLFSSGHGDLRPVNPRARVITIPDVPASNGKTYKVLKGDFHIHTLFSDGQVMPRVRVQEAVHNGLDCISITDHIEYRPFIGGDGFKLAEGNDDHNIAYKTAKPEAERSNLILIQGTEITKRTMPPGHFNAIFIKDADKIADVVDDWKKMLAVATEQGGFVFWNHPGWVAPNSGGLTAGVPMSFTDEHEDVRKKGHLHGIEVFNGTSHYPIVSDWCNERDLGLITVSDIHSSEREMYGVQNLRRPITLVLAEERTEESIREAFFAHRTVGWVADMIFGRPEWVEKLFTACVAIHGGERVGNGTLVLVENKSDIPIHLQVGDKEYDLKPRAGLPINFGDGDKCRVTNWFVGTFKPLEFTFASLTGS